MNRVQEVLKPIAWLEGTWRTQTLAHGKFPTVKPFQYCEEIKFQWNNQPMLNYTAQSWHPETKKPMHRETGFIKIIPGTNKVALILAHNFGLTTIEEGVVTDRTLCLKMTNIGRPTEGTKGPAVTQLEREFKLEADCLKHVLYMATDKTPELHHHLEATYVKQST